MSNPKPVRGVAIRLTDQDECDVPLLTANTQLAFNAFIRVNFSPDIETGTDIVVPTASGDICIQDMDDDRLKGLSIEMELCGWNDRVQEMLINGAILLDGAGDIHGGVLPDRNQSVQLGSKMIEVWGKNAQKGACAGGTFKKYVRYIAPRAFKWMLSGDLTFENGSDTRLTLTGYAENNPNFAVPFVDPNDEPDLTAANITTIQNYGPLGWVYTDTLPTTDEAGYIV